jgi:hypothetical protein
VDLYNLLSIAIAGLQVQAAQIADLQDRVGELGHSTKADACGTAALSESRQARGDLLRRRAQPEVRCDQDQQTNCVRAARVRKRRSSARDRRRRAIELPART